MQAAGMRVVAYDPFLSKEVAEDLRIESLDLDDVLNQADFVTLHTPLTDKTRNLLNAERLAAMKDSVRIVNVARGGIVDEDALAKALTDGTIAAAALDVFSSEPVATDSPLFDAPNIITTPTLEPAPKKLRFAYPPISPRPSSTSSIVEPSLML